MSLDLVPARRPISFVQADWVIVDQYPVSFCRVIPPLLPFCSPVLPPSTTSLSIWKNWLITVCLCDKSLAWCPSIPSYRDANSRSLYPFSTPVASNSCHRHIAPLPHASPSKRNCNIRLPFQSIPSLPTNHYHISFFPTSTHPPPHHGKLPKQKSSTYLQNLQLLIRPL